MGAETWSLTAKVCDSCKASPAAVFCRADSAFLCMTCDAKIHAANKLASRHARLWVCEVCEQAPATVTCKADAASLCAACDRDIHSANPLARRHERLPAVPFYDAASAPKSPPSPSPSAAAADQECSEEEAEAASWLLPNKFEEESGSPEYKSADYLFTDMDPYNLDLDLISGEQKPQLIITNEEQQQHQQQKHYSSDGVVPVQTKTEFGSTHYPGPVVDGFPTYEMDYPGAPKPFMYNFTSQSISQSVSSSSMEVGVVPEDHSATMADISDSTTFVCKNEPPPVPVSGVDREARVLRYREKRKNRRFEKTIRYASRKAYAETRPRVKGRFAKRSEMIEVDSLNIDASSANRHDSSSYSVVPSF